MFYAPTDTYQVGTTLVVVGLSATVQYVPSKNVNGMVVKIAAGGGTLCLVQGLSSISSAGYPIGSTEAFSVAGPATFFLAAAGATMTAAVAVSYSAGYSLPPGG